MKPVRSPNRLVDFAALVSVSVAVFLGSSCVPKESPREVVEAISEPEEQAPVSVSVTDCSEQDGLLRDKDSTIAKLTERLESTQRRLDEAILEVVRAKAKQRSLESRAEAAAQLAEAEIALETYRGKLSGAHSSHLVQAEQRLARGNEEFDAQNFGGALYLAIQAKNQIRDGMQILESPEPAEGLGGETPFAPPLTLTVKTTSNLRDGPGKEFDVIDTLKTGTTVTGYGSKGEWVRVRREDGTEGWVHQRLLKSG